MQGREHIKPFFSTHAATKKHHKKVLQIANEQLETEQTIKSGFGKRILLEPDSDFLACSFTRAGGTAIRRKLKRAMKKAKRKESKTPQEGHVGFSTERFAPSVSATKSV